MTSERLNPLTTCDKPDAASAAPSRSRTWQAAHRLAAQFPSVDAEVVARVLIDSRRAVDLFGLSHEQELEMAEKIAVERLRQLIGESDAISPRLDPEKRRRRRRGTKPTESVG
jgi:hypothetical protein